MLFIFWFCCHQAAINYCLVWIFPLYSTVHISCSVKATCVYLVFNDYQDGFLWMLFPLFWFDTSYISFTGGRILVHFTPFQAWLVLRSCQCIFFVFADNSVIPQPYWTSQENLQQFPVDHAYMPEVMNRLSLARQIDKIARKSSQASPPVSKLSIFSLIISNMCEFIADVRLILNCICLYALTFLCPF